MKENLQDWILIGHIKYGYLILNYMGENVAYMNLL